MNNFVSKRHQSASPHNAQPISNSSRQAIAANAKVTTKDRVAAQKPQTASAIPSRGLANAQNSSATHQVPQQWQSGPGHGATQDPYNTDAESLDTTVNASEAKDEELQVEYLQRGPYGQTDNHGESPGNHEEESDGEEEEEEEAEGGDFTPEQFEFLVENRLDKYPREDQVKFLQRVGYQGFRTVDGDSYPSTTDGQPTQWEADCEPPSRELLHSRPVAQPLPVVRMNAMQQNHDLALSQLFQQGAGLRDQRRSAQVNQPSASNFPLLPSVQPPAYGQANIRNPSTIPSHSIIRPIPQNQINQDKKQSQKKLPGPHHVPFQILHPTGPPAPPNGLSTGGFQGQAIGIDPEPEDVLAEQSDYRPAEDYEHAALFAKSYEDLKAEKFDLDPRANSPVLGDDILQKPLADRLEFVRKNLDIEKQSMFFSSLPTAEWEDAGDWFLDQFQSIIQRTKEARKTKRKLAQGFEDEVEKRYTLVSKKQRQVEAAMGKMKQQGEGLVRSSPLPAQRPQEKKR